MMFHGRLPVFSFSIAEKKIILSLILLKDIITLLLLFVIIV
jgi:hypothetical protein